MRKITARNGGKRTFVRLKAHCNFVVCSIIKVGNRFLTRDLSVAGLEMHNIVTEKLQACFASSIQNLKMLSVVKNNCGTN